MKANQLYDLRHDLHSQGITFAYCGYVTENILSGVGDALKQKLKSQDADTRTIRSVFAVFVEQMQNIIRYSVEQLPPANPTGEQPDADEPRYGILTIGQEGEDYVVYSGNLIAVEDKQRLQERLSKLQTQTRDELKMAYKEQLRAGPDDFSKGAGIGFIEIARRASKPIEFDFMQIDDKYSFFTFKATI